MENCKTNTTSRKKSQDSKKSKIQASSKLLINAVKFGNETLVRKLISLPGLIYTKDQFGCSPIYYAARYNHLNIMKILIEHGGFDETVTHMNRTALQIAAYHGNDDCVQYLLDVNANVNAVDDLGMSALHWAAENNHKSTVEILLKSGADPNFFNKFGKTAQRLAFLKNNIEIYKLLLNSQMPTSLEYDQDSSMKSFSVFLSETNAISDSSILKNRIFKSAFENNVTNERNDPIKVFEQHGIKLLPVDESTLIANALKRGQKAVLTEAGKLALKKTEPSILQNLVEPMPPYSFVQMSSIRQLSIADKTELPQSSHNSRNVECETDSKSTKSIKLDSVQSLNMTKNDEKLPTTRSSKANLSQNKTKKPRKKTSSTVLEKQNQSQDLEKYMKFFEEQLSKKSEVIKSLRNQLSISLKLIKSLKTKYDMKEREASLYKIQLKNLLKMLSKKRIINPNDA